MHLPVGPPFPRFCINNLWSFNDLDCSGFTWTASFTSKLALVTGIDRPGRELNQPHWSNLSRWQIQLGPRYGFMWYYSRSRQKVIGSDGLQHQRLNKWTVEAFVSMNKFWLIHVKKTKKKTMWPFLEDQVRILSRRQWSRYWNADVYISFPTLPPHLIAQSFSLKGTRIAADFNSQLRQKSPHSYLISWLFEKCFLGWIEEKDFGAG